MIVVGYLLADPPHRPRFDACFSITAPSTRRFRTYEAERGAHRRERAHARRRCTRAAARRSSSWWRSSRSSSSPPPARSCRESRRRARSLQNVALLPAEAAVPAAHRRRSRSRSSASSRATARPARCARCSGRASWCRRSRRSSPTTSSSRSRSPRSARRSGARRRRRAGAAGPRVRRYGESSPIRLRARVAAERRMPRVRPCALRLRASLHALTRRHAPHREARGGRSALQRARAPALLARRCSRDHDQAQQAEQGARRPRAGRRGVRRASATSRSSIADDREALADPELARARRRRSCPSSRPSSERLEEELQLLLLPQRSERQEEHDPRDPRRRGRRRSGALRGRPLPHVRALRRAQAAGRSRSLSISEASAGGYKEVIALVSGQQRLLAPALRGRRAPRAARAGDRDAGTHPHVDRDGRRAARGRRRRRADRRQGPRHLDRRVAAAPAGRASTRRTAPCRSATCRPASS